MILQSRWKQARAGRPRYRRSGDRPTMLSFHYRADAAPQVDYCFSADSTAAVTCGESGVTAGSNRATGLPFRSKRNLVKFHLMSPPTDGFADLSVRKT